MQSLNGLFTISAVLRDLEPHHTDLGVMISEDNLKADVETCFHCPETRLLLKMLCTSSSSLWTGFQDCQRISNSRQQSQAWRRLVTDFQVI